MPARTQTKQKKLGDYIDVWFKDVGDGIAAKVYRTDESDAEWEAKKAQAASRAKGSPAEWKSMPEKVDPSKDEIILQGGKVHIPRGPLSDDEWKARVKQALTRNDLDSYAVNGNRVALKGKAVEDWSSEETRAVARSLKRDGDAGEPVDESSDSPTFSTREEAEAWAQKVGASDKSDVRPARVVPSDGNSDVKPAKVAPAPVAYAVVNGKVHEIQPAKVVPADGEPSVKPAQVIEADEPKGAGFSVKNPMGIIADMSKGAIGPMEQNAIKEGRHPDEVVRARQQDEYNATRAGPQSTDPGEPVTDKLKRKGKEAVSAVANALPKPVNYTVPQESNPVLDRVNAQGEQHGREDVQGLKNFAGDVTDAVGNFVKDPLGLSVANRVAQTEAAGAQQRADAELEGQRIPEPANPSFGDVAGDVARFFNPGVGAVGPALTAAFTPAPEGGIRDADPLDPAAPAGPPPVPPGGSYPGLGLPPPPSGTGSVGGMSASASLKLPGGGYTPSKVDFSGLEGAIADQSKVAQGAYERGMAGAESIKQKALELEKKNLEIAAINDRTTQEQIATQRNAVETFRQYMTAHQQKVDEVERVSAQGVDPGRFWNNKSAGQKAAAVIAGALFGFTGQGMQWLQRLDGLVAEDNRLQAEDLTRKIEGLRFGASALKDRAGMELVLGDRTAAMLELSKAQKLKEAEMYLRNFTLTTQSEEMRAKADSMLLELSKYQVQNQQSLAQLAQQEAMRKDAARRFAIEQANENARFKLKLDAADGGKGGKMSPGQQERFSQYLSGAKAIANAMKEYRDYTGGKVPGWAGATSVLPRNISDSAVWEKTKRGQYSQIVGLPIEGGKMTDSDREFYKEGMPSATDTDAVAEAKVESLVRHAASKYAAEYQVARATNTEGWQNMPTPEEFEAVFRQEAGLSGGVPGERAR